MGSYRLGSNPHNRFHDAGSEAATLGLTLARALDAGRAAAEGVLLLAVAAAGAHGTAAAAVVVAHLLVAAALIAKDLWR